MEFTPAELEALRFVAADKIEMLNTWTWTKAQAKQFEPLLTALESAVEKINMQAVSA